MLVPDLSARIKQINPGRCFGINAGEIRSFVQVALSASPSQIVGIIIGLMDFGNNVINMERPFVLRFRKSTVFAPSFGSQTHEIANTGIHALRTLLGKKASSFRFEQRDQCARIGK